MNEDAMNEDAMNDVVESASDVEAVQEVQQGHQETDAMTAFRRLRAMLVYLPDDKQNEANRLASLVQAEL
jgi:hypothetical protein